MRFSAFILILLLYLLVGTASAQGEVTADDVNAIAKQLFCPVCENEPLDQCGTKACQDWRAEIRLQLEQGATEQEIKDNFQLHPRLQFLRPCQHLQIAIHPIQRFASHHHRPIWIVVTSRTETLLFCRLIHMASTVMAMVSDARHNFGRMRVKWAKHVCGLICF